MKIKIFVVLCFVTLNAVAQSSAYMELGFADHVNGLIPFHEKRNEPQSNSPKQLFKTFQNSEMTQLFDSVYFWEWERNSNGWHRDPIYKAKHYKYDVNNNLLSYRMLNKIYVGQDVQWIDMIKDTFAYDVNNNRILFLRLGWDINTSSWVNMNKETSRYDLNNNKISTLFQVWKSTTQAWENGTKTNSVYDLSNNQIEYLKQFWNISLNTWDNIEAKIFTYDLSNNKISSVEQRWDTSTESWENKKKYLYTYDENGNQIFYVDHRWDNSSESWKVYEKYSFSYDSNNKMIEKLGQVMSLSTNNFVDFIKISYSYDSNNNLTSELEQVYNRFTVNWVNKSNYVYNYDANNNLTKTLRQFWSSLGYWYDVLSVSNTYDSNNFKLSSSRKSLSGNFISSGDSTHSFYTVAVAIPDLVAKEKYVDVFPNPAFDLLYVSLSIKGSETVSLCLRNAVGQVVYVQSLFAATTKMKTEIQVSHLPSGLYFLSADGGGWSYSEKIMLK